MKLRHHSHISQSIHISSASNVPILKYHCQDSQSDISHVLHNLLYYNSYVDFFIFSQRRVNNDLYQVLDAFSIYVLVDSNKTITISKIINYFHYAPLITDILLFNLNNSQTTNTNTTCIKYDGNTAHQSISLIPSWTMLL